MADEPTRLPLGGVIESGLKAAASVARSIAQATSDTPLPPPRGGAVESIVMYGATTIGNVLAFVVASARPRTDTPTASTDDDGPHPRPRAEMPSVRAGSTLRVPLLVENTGAVESGELQFTATSLDRVDVPPGPRPVLALSHVQFAPKSLAVGPHDFEKLTVRISTNPTTPAGLYRATLVGGDGWFATQIDFAVTARTD